MSSKVGALPYERPQGSFSIESYRESHHRGVCEIYEVMVAEKPGALPYTDLAAFTHALQRGLALMVSVGPRVVGCGVASDGGSFEELSRQHAFKALSLQMPWRFVPASTHVGSLDGLYIHPSWRGRGMGGELLRDVEAGMYDAGTRILTVCSPVAAVSFFQAQGYTPVSPPSEEDAHVPPMIKCLDPRLIPTS